MQVHSVIVSVHLIYPGIKLITTVRLPVLSRLLTDRFHLPLYLDQAKAMGLASTGDRIVVSRCPRKGKHMDVMEEAGVVILHTVE